MTTEAAGLGLTDVLAALRCRDVHPERSVTCHACRSWGAHVAEEVRTWLRAALPSPEVVEAGRVALCKAGGNPDLGNDFHAHATETRLTTAALAAVAETLGAK